MGKEEIIAVLRDYKTRCGAEHGIEAMGLFGSAARGELREGSDVDVVVRLIRPELFTLGGFSRIYRSSFTGRWMW